MRKWTHRYCTMGYIGKNAPVAFYLGVDQRCELLVSRVYVPIENEIRVMNRDNTFRLAVRMH